MWDIINQITSLFSDEFEEVRREAVKIAEMETLKNTQEIGAKNRGPVVDIYLRNAHALKKDADPTKEGLGWCGMFIYYCYSQAAMKLGKTLPFGSGNLWSGQKLKRWALNNSSRIVREAPLQPGDIYVMNSYHIGMVIEGFDGAGDVVKTVDGNQTGVDTGANSVKKGTRHFSQMQVVIRI